MKLATRVLALAGTLCLPTLVTAGPHDPGDGDGVPDVSDFCNAEFLAPIPIGCDTDMDGYGNACDGDLNNDGLVNGADFTAPGPDNDFLDCFASGVDPNGIGCDINCDGLVGGADFNGPLNPGFLDFFSSGVPGPSGLGCAGTVPCP